MVELNTILVPVDGSEAAARAVVFASTLAGNLGRRMILLHAVPLTSAEMMGLRAISREKMETMASDESSRILDSAERLVPSGIEVVRLARMGDPAKEILAAIPEYDVNLVVMGSRGQSQISELMLGSVSQKVLHLSRRPVTVVH